MFHIFLRAIFELFAKRDGDDSPFNAFTYPAVDKRTKTVYRLIEMSKLAAKPNNDIPPKYIYLDEKTGQIKEELLDSAGASMINRTMQKYENPAKIIHESIFNYC